MPLEEQTPSRLTAVRAWSGRQAARVRSAAAAAWARTRAAPWKRIGLWAGGALGVIVTAFLLFLTFADWNALRGPVARFASAASGRQITISGDLDVRPWSFTPEVRVGGLKIGNPARYADRGNFAEIAQANVAVRLFPLFIGRFDIARLELEGASVALYRSAEGVSNWSSTRSDPVNLPAIQRFSVRNGRIRYDDDKRKMNLDALFTSNENVRDENGRFELAGDGRINGQPFRLELSGAALLNVRRDRPYPFQADVTAGATHIVANGSLTRPFNISRFEANIDATGADLADLYYLLGLTLPNTPPYHLTGVVARNGQRYSMQGIEGRVGDSDLAGQFTVTRQRDDRPLLEGAFTTRSLDWDDVLTVFGAPPSVSQGETASPEQVAEAGRLAAQGRLLPDARLDISRVRNMDARVSYRAARVRAPNIPLRALDVSLTLDHGLLRADPIDLGLSQGRIAGSAEVNAREDVPRVALDVRLSNARIESFLPAMENGPAMTGALSARVRLVGRGAAVREAAANADGAVSFVIPSGEVREAFAELTGINVTRGLGLLLTGDQSKIDIRCGVADFQVRNGVLNAQSIVVDTETMLITGGGSVSLREETLDLDIHGEPKEARLIRLSAPISITGRIRSPSIGVDAGEVVEQGGVAALLASLVSPLTAVLPFIDVGLADDANCAALLAEARTGRPARAT